MSSKKVGEVDNHDLENFNVIQGIDKAQDLPIADAVYLGQVRIVQAGQ